MIARSWTDPYSNDVELAQVDLIKDLDALVSAGDAPQDLLLSFVHEVAHHWCFTGWVGWAAAEARLRARKTAVVMSARRSTGLDTSLMLDAVAADAATAVLQPFAEGLAVAFEADVVTRKTNFLSDLFASASSLFGLPIEGSALVTMGPLQRALFVERSSDSGVSRKLNVYADVLRSPSGYLLGYLAVRGLWTQLNRQLPRLVEEGDLALAFLRSYMYDDLALVDVILERETGEIALAQSISSYVADRLENLSKVTPQDVETFEMAAASGRQLSDDEMAMIIHSDPRRSARGMERLLVLHEEIGSRSDIEGQLGAFTYRDLEDAEILALNSRDLVYLGSQNVLVSVSGDQYAVFLGRNELFSGSTSRAISDYQGAGWLDLCFSVKSDMRARMLVISTETDVVDVRLTTADPGGAARADDLIRPRAWLRDARATLDGILNQELEHTVGGIALRHLGAQFPAVVESIYVNLLPWHGDDVSAALESLRSGGLRDFLGSDKELARALAVVSLNFQTSPLRMIAEAKIHELGVADPKGAFDQLLGCADRGLRLVMENDKGWYYCSA